NLRYSRLQVCATKLGNTYPPVGEKVPEGRLREIRAGSWSQCTEQESWGLSMNLTWTNPPLAPTRRGTGPPMSLPSREGLDRKFHALVAASRESAAGFSTEECGALTRRRYSLIALQAGCEISRPRVGS